MKDFNLDGGTNDVDIFDAVPEQERRNYFTFNNVGDGVQGTYIGRNDNSVNGYGMPQTLVTLKKKDGEIVTVSIRHSKTGLLKILDTVKLGQIIGFKFTGTKDNPGKQPTKFIRLAADPNIVDKEWLESQKNGIKTSPAPVVAPKGSVEEEIKLPVSDKPLTDEEKIRKIAEIARAKLGAADEVGIKAVVMEKTGLAFIKINLDLILERLSKY